MSDCCPFCGAELSLSAERCRDCNLSQDPSAAPTLPGDDSVEEVAYEVTDWPVGSRLRLTSVLAERGIPWRWEPVLNLVVLEDDDVAAEAVLDEIEAEELGLSPRDESQAVADGDDKGWDDEDADGAQDMEEDQADEEYEDDADDEDNEGDEPYEDDADDDDGAVAQAAMADLFVAADRLMHEPQNLEVAVQLEAAAEIVDCSPAPFGIDDATWSSLRELAGGVRDALDHQPAPAVVADDDGARAEPEIDEVEADELVAERARLLRDTLRSWV